jgi:hypothetical protein
MRPQAGVGRLKPAPPLRANGLPQVAQAVNSRFRFRIAAHNGYNPFVREDHMAKDRSPKKEVKKPKKKK